MNISKQCVLYGTHRFKRSEVTGFRYDSEENQRFVYLDSLIEPIKLGFTDRPWPFEEPASLRHKGWLFMPEHIIGYEVDHGKPLRVWTKINSFNVEKIDPNSYDTIKMRGDSDSSYEEWLTACKMLF